MKNFDIKIMAKEFVYLKLDHLCLERDSEQGNNELYFTNLEPFLDKFRDFLRKNEFIYLSKKDFILLCAMASKYRPIEPHSFLTRISMQVDEDLMGES